MEVELILPPGFGFHPTDDELILHNLENKALYSQTIADVDLYMIEPWDLSSKAKMSENEWCFFSPKDRKNPTTARTNRATASGYWKAAAKDKNICSNRVLDVTNKNTGRAPIEHPAGVDVSIADMRRFPTSDALHKIKFFTAAELKGATRNFSTRIGEGGFGEVYKGWLHPGNGSVALKRYITQDLREVFMEEVRIHSKISHKNVVKPLGYCIGEHTLMSVMECMPKGNLNDRLHHSEIPIPLDVRLGIAIGCAEALSYMHSMHLSSSNRICHGDIKPANILLDDNFTAKLTDFGLSRLLGGGITRYTKTVKGSIEYMDPICIQEGCLTPRGDVYSFGLVLCEIIARKRVRKGDTDPIYTQEGCPTRMEIARDMASALVFLLDEKVEPKISDFGLSRVHHADDYTHIPMGRAVHTHNGWFDAKFTGKPSAKRGIETSIGSHVSRRPRYLSVHHHPLMQILPSARKWITSKRTLGDIFKAWISAKPTYETPNINAGPVSEYIIRKLFDIWNGLTENESQQHSDPEYSRQDHGKKAVNTKTSASWTIATAAPHHATGNRSLLSGFVTEHDDQFVHAVNRVPMKVLARGAVVTDTLILPDVWFVPGLTENLVSVSQLAELDHSIGFGRGECCIRSARDAKIVGKGRLQKGGHYVLDYLKVPLAI